MSNAPAYVNVRYVTLHHWVLNHLLVNVHFSSVKSWVVICVIIFFVKKKKIFSLPILCQFCQVFAQISHHGKIFLSSVHQSNLIYTKWIVACWKNGRIYGTAKSRCDTKRRCTLVPKIWCPSSGCCSCLL